MMQAIESLRNPRLHSIHRLINDARYRKKSGDMVLEGIHLAALYVDYYGAPHYALFAQEDSQHHEVEALLQKLRALSCEIVEVKKSLYNRVSTVSSGVGVMLVAAQPKPIVPTMPTTAMTQQVLAVDGVQDPGNLGAVLRSAAAAGITEIYLSPDCVAAWSPKVLRAAMGAHFSVRIYEDKNLADIIAAHAHYKIFALSGRATQTLYTADLSGKVLWLLGSEGRGLQPQFLKEGDEGTIMPLRIVLQNRIESLNVAVAAGIAFFEKQRQDAA